MPQTLRDFPALPVRGDAGASIVKGTATLNGISNVSVSCPQITANSIVLSSIQAPSGTLGVWWVSSRTPGVGFTFASIALNASTVGWAILEP